MYLKELKGSIQADACTPVFIAALFTMAKTCEQPTCLPTMNGKQNVYVHAMECHSTTKQSEALTYATTWMNLQHIILSEISQPKMSEIVHFTLHIFYPNKNVYNLKFFDRWGNLDTVILGKFQPLQF